MADEVEKAKQRLENKASKIQKALDDEAARKRKKQVDQARLDRWYREAPDVKIAQGYLKALTAIWRGEPTKTVGDVEVSLNEIWKELTRRQLAQGSRHGLESKNGALHIIDKIARLKERGHTERAVELALDASRISIQGAPLAVLALYALKTFHPAAVLASDPDYVELENRINASLARGDGHYVRTSDYDKLLLLLFPSMEEHLSSSFATRQQLDALLAAREAKQAHEFMVAERRVKRLALVQKGRAEQAKKAFQATLKAEIDLCASKTRWVRTILGTEQAGQLYGLYGGRVKLIGLNSMQVFKTALDFKGRGQSISAMLYFLPIHDSRDIRRALKLLHLANVCVVTDDTLLAD